MRKIIVLLLAAIMVFGLAAACAKPEPQETPVVVETTPEPSVEATPEPTVEATPEQPAAPENISPTTGLENTTTTYKPVWVQIDNEAPARPQSGMQLADVVYETPIEGADTRLSAIFNDVIWSDNGMDKVVAGAVRSSRYYHQWIQSEWDALYVHMGGPDKTNNPDSDIWGAASKHIKQRINGAGKGAVSADMFFKNDKGDPISHFAMTDVKADAAIMKYEPKPREPFKYYPLEAYADAPQVESISLPFFNSDNFVSYQYDAASDKLLRYMKGKEFIAKETGKPVEVQNLIVQYVSAGDMANDAPRKMVNVFGEGPAEFVIHGKYLEGTWKRADVNAPTKYYLQDGKEVTLTPGNTWIAMHPNTKNSVVKLAGGATAESAAPSASPSAKAD